MYNLHFMVLIIIVVMVVVVMVVVVITVVIVDNWGHNNWLCIVATVEARVV